MEYNLEINCLQVIFFSFVGGVSSGSADTKNNIILCSHKRYKEEKTWECNRYAQLLTCLQPSDERRGLNGAGNHVPLNGSTSILSWTKNFQRLRSK